MTVTTFVLHGTPPDAPQNTCNYGVDLSTSRQHRGKVVEYAFPSLSATINNAVRVRQGRVHEPANRRAKTQKIHSWRELDKLKGLPENWNGYGSEAPNRVAMFNARNILSVLHELGAMLEPKKIVPSAEDGVAIFFENGKRHGLIECTNDDEIGVIVYELGGKSESWPVADDEGSIRDTLDRITAYIDG